MGNSVTPVATGRSAAATPPARPRRDDRQTATTTPDTAAPSGPLTLEEVREAFEPLQHRYGPILFLEQAVELSGYTRGTLLKKLSQGYFLNSAMRGKPVRFWRDRLVLELMNGPSRSLKRKKPKQQKKDNLPKPPALPQDDASISETLEVSDEVR